MIINLPELDDSSDWTLEKWKSILEELIKDYGKEAILKIDAGFNSISFDVEIKNDTI